MGEMPRALAKPTLCGLLADRPTQLSASMHNAGYRSLGLDFFFTAFDTIDTAAALASMRLLGIRGFSLTIPHKEIAVGFVDQLSPEARETGSVNTVVNDGTALSGFNTDVFGVTAALEEAGFLPSGARALVLGAGGAARAGIWSLKRMGVGSITVVNRTFARAERLAAEFSVDVCAWDELRLGSETTLLMNSTPLGSHLAAKDDTEALLKRLEFHPGLTVFDMVTRPTPLLERGREAGARAIPGTRMLLHQALEQFRLFTGHEPPKAEMERALAQALAV